jgi:predicted glycogen debranching enzyme
MAAIVDPSTIYGSDVCRNLELATHQEWMEQNALGACSSSTIAGINTRRTHGLLTTVTPEGRFLMLSKLEETLVANGREYPLSANQYADTVHPHGYLFQQEFRRQPFPQFVYEAAGFRIEKRLFLARDENTLVLDYRTSRIDQTAAPTPVLLLVRPLIAARAPSDLTRKNPALQPSYSSEPGMVRIRPYSALPAIYFGHNAALVEPTGHWYFNFEYRLDPNAMQSAPAREDLFQPFQLRFDLSRKSTARIIVSTEPRPAKSLCILLARERRARANQAQTAR